MNKSRALSPTQSDSARFRELNEKLTAAQATLREAEAELAQEQAAINAFRMHCRLQLGPWIEELQNVQAEKQQLLTHFTMWQQAVENGKEFDAAAWFSDEVTGDDSERPQPDDDPIESSSAEGSPLFDPLPTDRKAEKRLYRELARRFHPDLIEDALLRTYATSMMAAVNEAYAAEDIQALRDLAGELDPAAVKQFTQTGGGPELKRLQKRLRKCRQRERKVRYQLQSLQQEMVARLWRKAQQVDPADGENWWAEVAGLFRQDIERISAEVGQLHAQLSKITSENTPPAPDSTRFC